MKSFTKLPGLLPVPSLLGLGGVIVELNAEPALYQCDRCGRCMPPRAMDKHQCREQLELVPGAFLA